MKKLLIATKNQGKLKELKEFLSGLGLEIVSLKNLKVEEEIEEDGKTYEENSKKKALFFSKLTNLPTIADDGGIEIEALRGEPGIRSRRWLGDKTRDMDLINHMKKISKNLPKNNRKAFFKTVITFALPGGEVFSAKGQIGGIIAKKPFLEILEGYPYRSFFYLPKIGKYYHESELTEKEQKMYNHRYKAIQKLIPKIIEKLKL